MPFRLNETRNHWNSPIHSTTTHTRIHVRVGMTRALMLRRPRISKRPLNTFGTWPRFLVCACVYVCACACACACVYVCACACACVFSFTFLLHPHPRNVLFFSAATYHHPFFGDAWINLGMAIVDKLRQASKPFRHLDNLEDLYEARAAYSLASLLHIKAAKVHSWSISRAQPIHSRFHTHTHTHTHHHHHHRFCSLCALVFGRTCMRTWMEKSE